jgi:hypothetical protein
LGSGEDSSVTRDAAPVDEWAIARWPHGSDRIARTS